MENQMLKTQKLSIEKAEAIKTYLTKEGVEYWTDVHVGNSGITLPLYIPKYRIAVHVGDDTQWYNSVKRTTHPVFIRESDSKEFVVEKLQNTIHRVEESWKRSKKRVNKYVTPNQRKMARRKARTNRDFQACLRAETIHSTMSKKK